MRTRQGFTLLGLLLTAQMWCFFLAGAYFFLRTFFLEQKAAQAHLQNICKVQEQLVRLKGLPWPQIVSNPEQGLIIEDLAPTLKKVEIATGNILVGTVIFRDLL